MRKCIDAIIDGLHTNRIMESCNIFEGKMAYTKGSSFHDKLFWALCEYLDGVITAPSYQSVVLQNVETDGEGKIKNIEISKNYNMEKDDKIPLNGKDTLENLVKKFHFKTATVGLKGVYGYRIENGDDITDFLKFLNKNTGKLKGCVSYK